MTGQPAPSPWFCLLILVIIMAITVVVALGVKWALGGR